MKQVFRQIFSQEFEAWLVWLMVAMSFMIGWLCGPYLDSYLGTGVSWWNTNIIGQEVEGWWETPIVSMTPEINSKASAEYRLVSTPWGELEAYPSASSDIEGVLFNSPYVMVQYEAGQPVMVANYFKPLQDFQLVCRRINEELRKPGDPINLWCLTSTIYFEGKYYEWKISSTRWFHKPLSTDPEFFFKR